MLKNIKNLKWESVALEGFPTSMTEKFQGFVGLEECTNYGLDKNEKKLKKKTKPQKRELEDVTNINKNQIIPRKKTKMANGFIVETCNAIKPSLSNENNGSNKKYNNVIESSSMPSSVSKSVDKTLKKDLIKKSIKNKLKKPKLGEKVEIETECTTLTPEDMLSWAEFKLPDEILKALMELGFKNPTKIQQLTLPAAIHGRRDILGAAETGSGKTLAFGIPILSGIMKLKEKALSKGLDIYEIPYKKKSIKKIQKETKEVKKSKKQKVVGNKGRESSGYSSGDNNSDYGIVNNRTDTKATHNDDSDDEIVEEYEVPIWRRKDPVDESEDSEEDNYTHLSDMIDSEDSSSSEDEDLDNEDVDGNETEGVDEVDETREGIGCVKVEDNIEFPGHVLIKTGKPLYALILTPTRELAIQISRHLIATAKYTGIKVATIVGGMAAVKQERQLRSGPEVVVATPGRLWELITQGEPHLQQLASVKFLAIDETDRMVERGHFEELEPLLERLNVDESHRSARQNFVFSATLTMVHDLPSHMKGKKVTKRGKILNRKVEKMTPQQKIKKLVDKIGMTDAKVVDITAENLGTADTLTESRIACSLDQKDAYLYYILKRHPGRTIVFCNSIGSVKRLAQLLTVLKCRPLPLHAGMPQRQRLKNLERFRDDAHGVLVATDVAARGLDIPNVDHVVHYQVPKTAENYVHRSGRTARATKEGLTILMIEPSEAYSYTKLCRTLNKTSEIPTFPVQLHSIAPIKDLMKVARELDGLLLKKRRATQAMGWREKAAKEMDMIIDEDDVPMTTLDPSIDKALNGKKRQLESLLSRPLFPKGFSFKYPTLNDPAALQATEENALQVMKKALESGELKKDKRKSKNQPLLQLEKSFKK